MHFLEILNIIQTQYPEAMAFLSDPEIAQIYIDFVTSNADDRPAGTMPMTEAERDARLRQTAFYRRTPDSARQWMILKVMNPAEAEQRTVDMWNLVNDTANNLGVTFAGQMGVDFVELALANGWDANQVRYHMMESVNKGLTGGGLVADNAAKVRSLAESYGIPISDEQALHNASGLTQGRFTLDSLSGTFATMASNLYPALSPILERGMTVREYAEPYFNLAVRELGINPNAIDLGNPAWMDLFLTTNDKGEQGIRTMGEALSTLRTDPRYGYDTGLPGRTEAARLSTRLLEMFGAKG